jgi:hypothetical protein
MLPEVNSCRPNVSLAVVKSASHGLSSMAVVHDLGVFIGLDRLEGWASFLQHDVI